MSQDTFAADDSGQTPTKVDLVNAIASEALAKLKAVDSKKTKSGREIYDQAVKSDRALENEIPFTTFSVYLSKLVNSGKSQITRPQGRYGYYLNTTGSSHVSQPDSDVVEETTAEKAARQKEKALYPVLRDWFRERDYRARIIANARGNGQWGHPDVAGIYCNDALGVPQIEVVTVEAKLSEKDWKRWFFEAVSHKRFANRVYFAFAHEQEAVSKLDPDLRYYSELYNVGVLIVAMSLEMFDKLQSGKLSERLINNDNVNIIELYSAHYSVVQPRYQIEYLQHKLGVESFSKLAQWDDEE